MDAAHDLSGLALACCLFLLPGAARSRPFATRVARFAGAKRPAAACAAYDEGLRAIGGLDLDGGARESGDGTGDGGG